MTVTSLTIRSVDLVGSLLMIVFSILSFILAIRIRNRDEKNVMGLYLFWVCLALTVFAISRSAGHILKQVMQLSGQNRLWITLSPFSGAINTLTLIVVGSVSLFFERVWTIYRRMAADQVELERAHAEVSFFNRHLEDLVASRTTALTASERKLRGILEVSLDILLEVTPEGRILRSSPSGKTLLGPDPLAANLAAAFRDGAHWESLKTSLLSGDPVASEAFELIAFNGNRMRALIAAHKEDPVNRDEAPTLHILVKNIESRLRLQEQVARADKLSSIGQLSAGVAHEINNPLGIIIGYTQLFMRSEPEGTQRHSDLQVIEKHAKHAKAIVEDLLNFARDSKPKRVPTNITQLVEEAASLLRLDSHRIALVVETEDPIPLIAIDPDKIRQVLVNLLMNASQAITDTGTITARSECAGDHVLVRILDTGMGISPEQLGRIFDPFFTTKPTGVGTGLGLSVSYGIVEAHGGTLDVTSTPGVGTEFFLRLPVEPSEVPPSDSRGPILPDPA